MLFDFSDCGGCTTCQLACSYKHIKAFSPEYSSIQIVGKAGDVGYQVELVDSEDGKRRKCDGCLELDDDMPLCVRYCHKRQDLMDIIELYRKQSDLEEK